MQKRIFAITVLAVALTAGPAMAARVYVKVGPPQAVAEVRVAAPGAGFVWVGGYHRWSGTAYVWVPGRWARPPRAHAAWIPGHWKSTKSGWYWIPGHWR